MLGYHNRVGELMNRFPFNERIAFFIGFLIVIAWYFFLLSWGDQMDKSKIVILNKEQCKRWLNSLHGIERTELFNCRAYGRTFICEQVLKDIKR